MLSDEEVLDRLKKNILSLSYAVDDMPYYGFSKDYINGIRSAIIKVLNETGITEETLVEEMLKKTGLI